MERERLAWRWGLVAVAAMALFVLRAARQLVVEVRGLHAMVTVRELLDRMSQLKPGLWKARGQVVLAIVLAAVLIGVLVMVWTAAWRSARRRS